MYIIIFHNIIFYYGVRLRIVTNNTAGYCDGDGQRRKRFFSWPTYMRHWRKMDARFLDTRRGADSTLSSPFKYPFINLLIIMRNLD